MIEASIAQFCGPVEIIVGQWIWLAHQAIGFKKLSAHPEGVGKKTPP